MQYQNRFLKAGNLFWSNSDQEHFFPPEIYTFPRLVSQVANLPKPLFLVENLYRLSKQMCSHMRPACFKILKCILWILLPGMIFMA